MKLTTCGFVVTICVGWSALGCGHRPTSGVQADAAPASIDANTSMSSCTDQLGCFVVDCAALGKPSTTVTGKVYAPNGTLPLYGATVYVPNTDPGPLAAGLTCDQCAASLPGSSVTETTTDETGAFTLLDVPATTNVPVVIQIGKWRRQLVLPKVDQCTDNPATIADTTLPKSRTDASPLTRKNTDGTPAVDMPYIAVTTGAFDALECLVYKMGIDPKEITNDTGGGHVQLFTNSGLPAKGQGAKAFRAGWPGGDGAAFGDAQTLWSTTANLSKFDIVMFSCEGGQYATTKPQSAMQAVHDYAGLGGRVFLSHWHNIWIGGEGGTPTHGLADWEAAATFNYDALETPDSNTASIDEVNNPKGKSFATWMVDNGGSTTRDQIPITGARYTCTAATAGKAERWAYIDQSLPDSGTQPSVQDLEFTTPIAEPEANRCGRVVFSDMHVASGSTSSSTVAFPDGCAHDASGDPLPLSPQEKALAFIFFDIASCVGPLQ